MAWGGGEGKGVKNGWVHALLYIGSFNILVFSVLSYCIWGYSLLVVTGLVTIGND